MTVSFLPDLHYSAAPQCKDLNFRAIYYVIWNWKGMETSLLTPADDQGEVPESWSVETR